MGVLRLSWWTVLTTVALVACSNGNEDDAAGSPDAGGSGDTGVGDTLGTDEDADAGSDGSTPDASEPFESGIDPALHLRELTDPQIRALCEAYGQYQRGFDTELRHFRCVAQGVDLAQIADPPVAACDNWVNLCWDVPILADNETDDCIRAMDGRFGERCVDPTVAEFGTCVVTNVDLELAVADRDELACEEAVPLVSVRPQGQMDCPCGVPLRIGPTPADDQDWDYVLDADDACPDTEDYRQASAWGCSIDQDWDGDRVWDEVDLCRDTDPAAPLISAVGCSEAQDEDLDDVPNGLDPCPGTATGAELVTYGCSIAQDEDADGAPNTADWCPFTPPGAAVLLYGCAPEQGEPWRDSYLTEAPEGLTSVTLGADQDDPVRMLLVPTGISETEDGRGYEGTILIEVPGGYRVLNGTDVVFTTGDGSIEAPATISGSMPLPFPGVELFDGFRIEPPADCEVGFGPGNAPALSALAAPLRAERFYLYLQCAVGFSASIGSWTFSLGDSRQLTFVLDPFDPSFYLRADVEGLGFFGKLNDVAVGMSAQGLIPFTPDTTWGVESTLEGLDGHLYVFGTVPVPIEQLPAELTEFLVEGEVVVDLDPQGDGVSFTAADLPDVRFGANGRLLWALNFFSFFEVQIEMGEASVLAELTDDARAVSVSGNLGPNALRLPVRIPLANEAPLRAAAYLTDEPGESYLVAEGSFRFNGSELNLPLIPDLLDVDVNGRLELDSAGVRVSGTMSGEIHDWVDFSGTLQFDAEITWDRRHFHVHLRGNMSFDAPGDNLTATDIYLGSDDIRIDGESYNPL